MLNIITGEDEGKKAGVKKLLSKEWLSMKNDKDQDEYLPVDVFVPTLISEG